MKYSNLLLAALAATTLTFTACGGGGSSTTTPVEDKKPVVTTSTLAGDITSDITLTADKTWIIDGLVAVKNGATLTIEAGTTIAGLDGTGASTSYMVIDKGSRILAEGTASKPIIFTSKKAVDGEAGAVGQWGGLTIIGNAANDQVKAYEVNEEFVAGNSNIADNSGTLKHVKILNSGITMQKDKEINGLSLVGVGSGTTIENITVDKSDDDGVEIWGGTVNLTNVKITNCTDDYFDIDDGYSGTVKNLTVTTTTGNAGIEMSGDTAATFDGFNITIGANQEKEGGIYFKKDGIGGTFKNGIIIDNATDSTYGAIHSIGDADIDHVTFENVKLTGSNNAKFTNGVKKDEAGSVTDADYGSRVALETKFDAGILTDQNYAPVTEILSGDITADRTLTADKIWILDGLVAVKNNAILTIEAGTTIAGRDGTGASTSYMIIDKGSRIEAAGTANAPITFTSKKAGVDFEGGAVGQWGGLTIVGNAANDQVKAYEVNEEFAAGTTDMMDNSGTLTYVNILNSGITMQKDKEINGLSLVGVGSGTTINNIKVDNSDDDGIELWGGTVNLSDITITNCTDDYFDIDDGYAGTVTNLTIVTNGGNAGIEMSGDTAATFNNFDITIGANQGKEGGIYFKKDGIGGTFNSGTVTNNSASITYGAIHSIGTANIANTSFENVTLAGTSLAPKFTNGVKKDEAGAVTDADYGSRVELESTFDSGTGNSK